jgi:glutamate synthase (NADPH/NADH) large chain
MSGGIAYVYDEDGTFASRCNSAALARSSAAGATMIELTTIGGDAAEVQRVRAIIESHAALTDSPRAARLLASWSTTVKRIVAVVPTEYRRALEAAAAGGSSRG